MQRRVRFSRRFANACVLLTLVLLTGCGQLGTSGKGQPYQIGYITDLSGSMAESYTPTWEGFNLYIQALNDRGGVNGHKVEVAIKDDRLDGARAAALAKELVEKDQVVGIFGLSLSSTHAPVLEQAQTAKVPVVSTFSGIKAGLPEAQPYYFSTGVIFEVAGEASGQILPKLVPAGALVVGTTFDSVGGRAAVRHQQFIAEQLGYKYDTVLFPVNTRDFTAVAQRIAGMNPAVVFGHYGSEQNLGMIPALRRAGYTGPYVVMNYGVTEEAVQKAAKSAGTGENLYFFTRYVSVDDGGDAVQQVRDAAKKYGTTKAFSVMHLFGWSLGKVAEESLKQCGWPCDGVKLNETLTKLKVEMGNLTGGPVQFTANDHYGPSHWWMYKYDAQSGKLTDRSEVLSVDQLQLKE